MSRATSPQSDIVCIGLLTALAACTWYDRELVVRCVKALFGLLNLLRWLAAEVDFFGFIDLMAAGATLLTVALGHRVLTPWLAPYKARRRERRREAHLKGLRDTYCDRGGGSRHVLTTIWPRVSDERRSDPPRPFDPVAAARFLQVLEFGDPYTALRAAGLRVRDMRAWLEAGLNWASEGDPRLEFTIQILEFIQRHQCWRELMKADESHTLMLGSVDHPQRWRTEIDASPLSRIESTH